jgi:hypothetical protein
VFPKKPCDYDSEGDYDIAKFDMVVNAPSKEKFAAGQYVVIKSKKDTGGYALCQVANSVNLSVAALLRGPKSSGYIQQYPPGQFALVTYCKTLDVVTHFL